MATYKHLRSSTANKRPTTSIADGQLAINTNTASPGLFFKDSAGTGIVKVGPVHVGTTAPNSVPAGSTGNYLGEQWLDTSVSPAQMKVWNGSAWIGVVADELPVSKLQDGSARQLLQTDAAGTGVEWTSNVDVPGTLDVTGATTLDSTLTVPAGSAAAPTVRFTGDTNTGIYSPGADQVALSTNGTERLSIDANGNVAIAAPGAGAAYTDYAKAIVFGSSAETSLGLVLRTGASGTGSIAFADNSGSGAGAQDGLIEYSQTTRALNFHTAGNSSPRLVIDSSGLVGIGDNGPDSTLTVKAATGVTPFKVSGPSSEFAKIDSSGRLLVGTSTSSATGTIFAQGSSSSTTGPSYLYLQRGQVAGASISTGTSLGIINFGDSASAVFAQITAEGDAPSGAGDYPGRLVFSTTADGASSPTERMRIAQNGATNMFTSTTNGLTVATAETASGSIAFAVRNGSTTPFNGPTVCVIRADGDLENANNSYGALSDIKLKENIVDANSQWNDIKALQVRNYNFKEGRTHTQIGLIAQEVELVSPGLVSESPDRDAEGNDLGTVTKSVNYSVLYMKAVKALQEAMERIETLEQRLNDAGIN